MGEGLAKLNSGPRPSLQERCLWVKHGLSIAHIFVVLVEKSLILNEDFFTQKL